MVHTFKNAYDAISAYWSSIGSTRHQLAQTVIQTYALSSSPLDILGVAYAYSWEGASQRTNAISYFERFLETNFHDYTSSNMEWTVFSTLANLYEKEYIFDKAIACLKRLITIDNSSNPADFTRIGDILIKIDVNKAESYYLKLLNSDKLRQHKRAFAYAYDDVMKKKEKGYVYKSRKKHSTV